MASNSSLRSSCAFPNLLLWLLNLTLRPRPTPFGWVLVAATLLSALASLYVHLARRHLPAHAALAAAVLCGHALASYALLLRRDRSLVLLGSADEKSDERASGKVVLLGNTEVC